VDTTLNPGPRDLAHREKWCNQSADKWRAVTASRSALLAYQGEMKSLLLRPSKKRKANRHMLSATAADPHAADFWKKGCQKHRKPNKPKPVRSRAQHIQQTLHRAHAGAHSPAETDERDHQDGDRLTDAEDHLHLLGAPLIEGFMLERLHLGDDGADLFEGT